jgi:hypothetical protein
MFSNNTDAESTQSTSLTAFNTDGFSLGDGGSVNGGSDTYVAWQWKCNGGTTSSNTDGSITSTVQANTTAGFSIVTYTGNGNDSTVGHGLGVTPEMFIVKRRTGGTGAWTTYHESVGNTKAMFLDQTNAGDTYVEYFNNTSPTSSVFSIGQDVSVNSNGNTYVAYCFNNVEGYSKIGSGTGTGTSSTNFIYTGFKPSWVMIKRTDSADSWAIFDNKRPSYNVTPNRLFADLSDAESTSSSNQIDMVSNGFVARGTSMTWNASSSSFIYMAFAEHPFVSSKGVPTTAR